MIRRSERWTANNFLKDEKKNSRRCIWNLIKEIIFLRNIFWKENIFFRRIETNLSKDIATRVNTEAPTETLAIKLFIVQYLAKDKIWLSGWRTTRVVSNFTYSCPKGQSESCYVINIVICVANKFLCITRIYHENEVKNTVHWSHKQVGNA